MSVSLAFGHFDAFDWLRWRQWRHGKKLLKHLPKPIAFRQERHHLAVTGDGQFLSVLECHIGGNSDRLTVAGSKGSRRGHDRLRLEHPEEKPDRFVFVNPSIYGQ